MGDTASQSVESVDRGRLRLLAGGLASAAVLLARPGLAAVAGPAPRSLRLQNTHTGERLFTPYWADGAYLPEGLDRIAHVLRDHRNDKTSPIDPKLLDLLHNLQAKLEVNAGFQVISGYRSPESNALLAAASDGVAKHSLHMDGKAIDVRVPGLDLKDLRRAALELSAGGVGFYPASDFVHVDVGRVRFW